MKELYTGYFFGVTIGMFATLSAMIIYPIKQKEMIIDVWILGVILLIMIIYLRSKRDKTKLEDKK